MSEIPAEILKLFTTVLHEPSLECMQIDPSRNLVGFIPRAREDYMKLERSDEDPIWVQLDGIIEMMKKDGYRTPLFTAVLSHPYSASSLLARAADSLPGCFALNESGLVLNVASLVRHGDLRKKPEDLKWLLEFSANFLSRNFKDGDITLVKLIAENSDIIEDYLTHGFCRRALFMHSDFQSFFAQTTKKERPGRVEKIEQLVRGMRKWWTINQLLPAGYPAPATPFDSIAWFWHVSKLNYAKLAQKTDLVASVAVNDFLEKPAEALSAIGRFLGYNWQGSDISKVVNSDVFSTHAKFSGKFSAKEREREIREILAANKDNFDSARKYLEALEKSAPAPAREPRPLFTGSP